MTEEKRISELRKSIELTQTGFAGIDRVGQKVDRRQHPKAMPFAKNMMLNVPQPRCVKCEQEKPYHQLVGTSICDDCRK